MPLISDRGARQRNMDFLGQDLTVQITYFQKYRERYWEKGHAVLRN